MIHEYQLTPYSLYAGVSVGLETEEIIRDLDNFSKNVLPESIKKFIRDCTLSYGKVKLVLQRNRFFVESAKPEVLQTLLKDPKISAARVKHQSDVVSDPSTGLIISRAPTTIQISGGITPRGTLEPAPKSDDLQARLADDDDEEDRVDSVEQELHSFEISPDHVEHVKKRCVELDFPMSEEYDFRNDTSNPDLNFDLKPATKVRPYQERGLSQMFGNGRARSGIIVLPCGAGKTLVGITAACTVKKSTLVLCTSGYDPFHPLPHRSVSVEQWRYQFKLWSTIGDKNIARFTSDQKEWVNNEF